MSSFGAQLRAFHVKAEQLSHDIFIRACELAFESIVEGSAISGAPGQPVDTGVLKASWQKQHIDANTVEISTNIVYAPMNEEGISGTGGPYVQRSPTGGRHSLKLSVAAWGRFVEVATAEVAGA